MLTSLPTWIIHYAKRRPRLNAPLTSRDYDTIEVGALDREGAEAAFLQRYPPGTRIVSISMGSPTGFS